MWQGSAASSGKWASIRPGQFSVPVSVGHRLGHGPTGMVDRLAGRSMSRMTALSRWRMASRSRADSVRRRSKATLLASQTERAATDGAGGCWSVGGQHFDDGYSPAAEEVGLASDQFGGLVVERDSPLQTGGFQQFVFAGFAAQLHVEFGEVGGLVLEAAAAFLLAASADDDLIMDGDVAGGATAGSHGSRSVCGRCGGVVRRVYVPPRPSGRLPGLCIGPSTPRRNRTIVDQAGVVEQEVVFDAALGE